MPSKTSGENRRHPVLFVSYFYAILYESLCCPTGTSCPNITVAVLIERSAVLDFPFQINRTIGIVELGINKSKELLQDSANVNYIIRYADVPTCTALEWGALAAEVYHNNEIHAIIGPGKYQHMSRLVGKPTMWFSNRSDTNRPVQAQKRARSLKFRI